MMAGEWYCCLDSELDELRARARRAVHQHNTLPPDERGNMAGQVMRPGRLEVAPGQWGTQEVRSAYAGYIAYFGTYDVSADGDTVVHHVHGALNPGWVGGDQVRRMRFDGDLLILSTDVPKGGAMVRHILTWQKLA